MKKRVRDIIDLPFNCFYIVVFSFHIIILLLWVIVLFNNSIRLRRKVKYSTLANYSQDTYLEALNNKVEYRKSLFLFAIVVCELVASVLSILSSVEVLIFITKNYIELGSGTAPNNFSSNCSKENIIPTTWEFDNHNLTRLLIVAFVIPLILTFSLVYTLMSYYIMVTKKSLSYNFSLKSVDLAREQKVLLLVLFIICIILLLLLVRVEMFIVFQIVESCFTIFQSFLTYHYSRKLIQVLNWKKKDTEIAFGTDDYQYKLYTKSIKSLKKVVYIYIIVVISFSIFVLMRTTRSFAFFLFPTEIYHLFGVCIHIGNNVTYFKYLDNIVNIVFTIENVPATIYLLSLFALNLATVPFLLSKMNCRCHSSLIKCLRVSTNKDLENPLLQ